MGALAGGEPLTIPFLPFLATQRGPVLSLFSFNGHTPTAASTTMGTDDPSRPSTPPNSIPLGYFPASFERFVKENEMAEWASAFTLIGECRPMVNTRRMRLGLRWRRVCWVDTVETFFDARIDLIQRALTKHSDRLKVKAEEAMNKMKSPSGEDLAENLDREMQKFKLKVCCVNHPCPGSGTCRD